MTQIERAFFHVIDHPPWRADNNVCAALEAAQLRRIALTAVNWQHMEARNVAGVALERFGNLNR